MDNVEEEVASDEDEGHQEDTNADEDDGMADPDFNGQVEEGIDDLDLDLYYGEQDDPMEGMYA